MNPLILNQLQNKVNQQGEGQNIPSQQPYNPFNEGIQRAISAARDSLGLTEKQQDKALRRSLLAFGNNIAQQPVRKGFWNNFGDIARSMSPAIAEYDIAEDEMMDQNNALARQILDYEARMEDRALRAQDRQIAADERKWQHQHAEDQLAELRRYHNMSEQLHKSSNSKMDAKTLKAQEKAENQESLLGFLDNANNLIDTLGDKGYRSPAERIFANFKPGGDQLTPEQQQIHTLGEILQGRLFHDWDYKSQAEFAHLPKISPANHPAVNKSIVKELINATKAQMVKKGIEPAQPTGASLNNEGSNVVPSLDNTIANQLNLQNASQLQVPIDPVEQQLAQMNNSNGTVSMVDSNGVIWKIPTTDIDEALAEGLKPYNRK